MKTAQTQWTTTTTALFSSSESTPWAGAVTTIRTLWFRTCSRPMAAKGSSPTMALLPLSIESGTPTGLEDWAAHLSGKLMRTTTAQPRICSRRRSTPARSRHLSGEPESGHETYGFAHLVQLVHLAVTIL